MSVKRNEANTFVNLKMEPKVLFAPCVLYIEPNTAVKINDNKSLHEKFSTFKTTLYFNLKYNIDILPSCTLRSNVVF